MQIYFRKTQGFTLIELVITITIIGVLVMVAIPELRSFILNNRLTTQTNALVGALNYARGDAISYNKERHLTAADPANWAKGWVVWVDLDDSCQLNSAGDQQKKNPCEELRSYAGSATLTLKIQENLTVLSQSPVEDALKSSTLTYRGDGTLAISAAQINIEVCDDRIKERGRLIQVLRTGRIQMAKSEYQCD